MKTNFTLLTLLFMIVTVFSYGQKKINSNHDFNLPPGAVFHVKSYVEIDYREKLQFSEYKEPVEKNYLDEFSNSEIEEMKTKYIKDYKYYETALIYFNSLSNKVKKTFTVDELWYIYKFDQGLKKTLQTIN